VVVITFHLASMRFILAGVSSRDTQIIHEHFDEKFESIVEAFRSMGKNIKTLAEDKDLREVKADVRTIKMAVTATNHDRHKLDKRVTKIETVLYI
jgi:hypothetical protein